MTLVKSWALERNQQRRKMLRMSKTKILTSAVWDRLTLSQPFTAARSVPPEVSGRGVVKRVSCRAGERMFSAWRGEDMVVRSLLMNLAPLCIKALTGNVVASLEIWFSALKVGYIPRASFNCLDKSYGGDICLLRFSNSWSVSAALLLIENIVTKDIWWNGVVIFIFKDGVIFIWVVIFCTIIVWMLHIQSCCLTFYKDVSEHRIGL